ncbi:50S ribosomal protein L21 [Spirochaeta africana]|uniref:Large ribosomal subunit protein bL21 n=1 Tax=Spirochaeta africana (strain ATCC 700263 / DSM 8902 / Z-7692) TaxID=889378 RepID=H9UK96_SPIAZ|nr:50S ribosomal protein L21 [Spirochaeta africana]AFG37939.1 ribosomal protein L21 [Spirochaeta africana DSM 8902]
MYAIVEFNGRQYKAEKGKVLEVDKLQQESGSSLTIDSVVMLRDDKKATWGTPYVKGAKVTATVEDTYKGSKITVYKYKRRKNYSRKQGSRPTFTRLRITDISA